MVIFLAPYPDLEIDRLIDVLDGFTGNENIPALSVVVGASASGADTVTQGIPDPSLSSRTTPLIHTGVMCESLISEEGGLGGLLKYI